MNKPPKTCTTPEYLTWKEMLSRCRNPNRKDWMYYGGRGIQVRFESFKDFYNEVGPRPQPSPTEGRYSIHRVDNDGHYEKGNVIWATAKTQAAPEDYVKGVKAWLETVKPTSEEKGRRYVPSQALPHYVKFCQKRELPYCRAATTLGFILKNECRLTPVARVGRQRNYELCISDDAN